MTPVKAGNILIRWQKKNNGIKFRGEIGNVSFLNFKKGEFNVKTT